MLASLLLVVFQGRTTQLINLYAVGVFVSFTLSQSGMVRHAMISQGSVSRSRPSPSPVSAMLISVSAVSRLFAMEVMIWTLAWAINCCVIV
jgi:hypothetical protein